MFDYLKNSFARKKARRVPGVYPPEVRSFQLDKEGRVEFANWKNPLVLEKKITQEEVNFFRKLAPVGSFCIDIGSNIGDTTVPMALAVGKQGLVIGFEPNPIVFKIFEVNSKLNATLTNIIPLEYAITEKDGEFIYSSSEASFGNGGISGTLEEAVLHGKFKLDQKIKGVNLLNYLKANYSDQLYRLSFIKIDVEGYDIAILRSIRSLIDQYKPNLVVECFSKSTPKERIELFHEVADHGYSLFYFGDFDENTEVIELSPEKMNILENFNFYAVATKKFVPTEVNF